MYGGGCVELYRATGAAPVSCCGTCHSDWDAGYDEPREVEFDGKVYYVCCAVVTPIVTQLVKTDRFIGGNAKSPQF